MKRKLSILMTALLLLVISVTSITPVFAQDGDEDSTDTSLSSLDGLALIAPIWAPLDTEVDLPPKNWSRYNVSKIRTEKGGKCLKRDTLRSRS